MAMNYDDILKGMNLSTESQNFLGNGFPHLAGAQFGIKKLFNEGSLGLFLVNIGGFADALLQKMQDGFRNRKSFDTLLAPFRADFLARNAPHLFRVRLEERLVELAAKAIDEELFEVRLMG